MTNPLLTDYPLPPFGQIRPEHAEPAVRALLEENRRRLATLLASGAEGWDGLVVPIERMHHALSRAWSPIGHLNNVMNGEELRAAYNACLPLLTSYHTELAQNAALCAAYQRILDQDGGQLAPEQRKLLENALLNFRLAGVSLPPERKQRYREVMERLASIQAKFDENVLDATNAWSRVVGDERETGACRSMIVERAQAAAAPPACPAGCCRSTHPITRRYSRTASTSRCGASSTRPGSRAPPTRDRTRDAGTTRR